MASCGSAYARESNTVATKKYTDIIVFGDSLSDMGNACPEDVWESATIFCLLYEEQRFTDGRLWIEYVAKRHNVQISASREGGNNYAFGGATSGWDNDGVPGLSSQVQQYLSKTKAKVDPNALYVIWIGGNDFKNKFASKKALLNWDEFEFQDLLEDIARNIQVLSAKGARHFLVPNLPPVHKTPAADIGLGVFEELVTNMAERLMGSIAKKLAPKRKHLDSGFDHLIKKYNLNLSSQLHTLQSQSTIHIHNPDVYSIFQNVIANYRKYGLKDTSELFCHDLFHPSAKAHKIIAEELWKKFKI